jgi:cell division control protein 6
MRTQSVFKDEFKLDINYVPDRLPHREKERRLLMEFFSYLLKTPDKMAQRVIVTGDIGTGKTALCHRVGQDLAIEAHKRQINLKYIHVNCREYRGKLAPIVNHVMRVLSPTYPTRGYTAEEVLATLLKRLDDDNVFLLLALDEFDTLIEGEGSDAVYNLTRMQEMRQDKPQRISFIFIMRNLNPAKGLDDSARSTLQRSVVRLEKYGKVELETILGDRVEMAFEPSTVPEDVISLTADLARSETGNARFAIELLWRAGKYADAEEFETVIPECVRKAISNILPSLPKAELENLGFHEKLFLLGAAETFLESGEAYVSLSEIEKAYGVACEEYGEQPVSHTQLWNYVKSLSVLGILKGEVSGEGTRGRSGLVSLPNISASELAQTLRELLKQEER